VNHRYFTALGVDESNYLTHAREIAKVMERSVVNCDCEPPLAERLVKFYRFQSNTLERELHSRCML